MVLMLLEMKSVTGVILAGSAHPTHVTPVTGKARSCRRRTTLDETDTPSSLASDAHAARPLAVAPPKAAPAMSRLAELPQPSSSSSSSSYSRGRFWLLLPCFSRRPPWPRAFGRSSPRTLAVLDPPSRSSRPRISSSAMEIGPKTLSDRFLLAAPAPRPAPAAAAHTGCCGAGALEPAACGRSSAPTASPCASGGTDPSSSLSDMRRGSH
jgi:hypothetical protein